MTPTIRAILLAEDSPADAEMAIDALREAHLANPIVHVQDGLEAMDLTAPRQVRIVPRPARRAVAGHQDAAHGRPGGACASCATTNS
jgi:hypothetical protein